VLDRLVFPLGDRTKDEARALLEARGLPARTRDSQDLCFVTGGRYAEALGREIAGIAGGGAGGRILDTEGNVVGTHRGHFAYTIGQRLGHHGRRSYVLKKRPDTNEVVVGDREMALAGRIEAGDANWFLDPAEFPDETVWVKFRYNSPAVRARLAETARGRFAVLTDEPCFAPAPGQVLACYRDGFLLGGGVITDTAP
jgi:tRNA-specific 2-thiouridylase